ncbi:pyridoxamine 5'-phosphate oxidase family protein [Peribacillus glennii]|uniref:Pyridoxamine 5'-phosphate oxidase N-terminal domain-containing protein n=1 Tax=Peribacillus glennii TaxID=2303991 RepID=A0A372LCJ5_9BACI|nr:pyridoxamine 5'-phosphate oxidase family protein [Peribacillus glennii]RFU63408.1 hypothetical protein D0466_11770 [Peribacillus glennii]
MANLVEPVLIRPLFEKLQQDQYVILATVDHETGGPNVNAISWLTARSEKLIYLAVDNRSRIVENIKVNKNAVITLIANESTYSISGNAKVKEEYLQGVPLKLALIEISVKEVRDIMFYGSKITVEPRYDKTYDELAAEKLDKQVKEAMIKH